MFPKRTPLLLGLLAIALLASVFYAFYRSRHPRFDWSDQWNKKAYQETNDQPYGTQIAHRLLESYFPGKQLRDLKKNVGTLLYEATTALPSGGIVSMGMFKPEEFSCPSFTAQTCIGIPGSVGKMNAVIMNHIDHTEVVFSTPEAYNTSGQLDAMIKEYRAYLNA